MLSLKVLETSPLDCLPNLSYLEYLNFLDQENPVVQNWCENLPSEKYITESEPLILSAYSDEV